MHNWCLIGLTEEQPPSFLCVAALSTKVVWVWTSVKNTPSSVLKTHAQDHRMVQIHCHPVQGLVSSISNWMWDFGKFEVLEWRVQAAPSTGHNLSTQMVERGMTPGLKSKNSSLNALFPNMVVFEWEHNTFWDTLLFKSSILFHHFFSCSVNGAVSYLNTQLLISHVLGPNLIGTTFEKDWFNFLALKLNISLWS